MTDPGFETNLVTTESLGYRGLGCVPGAPKISPFPRALRRIQAPGVLIVTCESDRDSRYPGWGVGGLPPGPILNTRLHLSCMQAHPLPVPTPTLPVCPPRSCAQLLLAGEGPMHALSEGGSGGMGALRGPQAGFGSMRLSGVISPIRVWVLRLRWMQGSAIQFGCPRGVLGTNRPVGRRLTAGRLVRVGAYSPRA